MNNNGVKITNKELVFLTNGSVVGLVWVYLPRALCKEAQQNAWLAVLISVLYPILSWILIERLLRRYPGQNFYHVSRQLFGKIIGSILFISVVIYFMLFSGTIISNFARLVKVYALPETPLSVIITVIVMCAIWVGIKGINVTAWFDEISLYLILFLMLVYCLPIPIGDYTNLLPVGQIPWQNLGRATLQAVWAQAGVETLLVFYCLVDSPQKVIKAGFISIGLNTLIYLWVATICVLVMGADITQQYLWPGLTILKVSYVSVFERLEFFFLLLVFFVVSRT
ncbi:GerAB/ArcD/ProY family transporter [Syntrophomonas palmitatica]|uniref:GerAB/ArcD/ProY family transporter n=1 Tax=Syntrophomonas palmitatica TaxID=402877 RepID=UPI0006D0F4AE|nr:GerAB/ArcD/ProY family transporter [Syntrophomonas palmitatica]